MQPVRSDVDSMPVAPVYQTDALAVYTVTQETAPAIVQHLYKLRALAYTRTYEQGDYDKDVYDERAIQIVARDRGTGELVGAMRLIMGREVMPTLGHNAFYLNRFWHLLPSADGFFSASIELGRAWVSEGNASPLSVIHALYVGVHEVMARQPGCRGLFGMLSVVNYPELACNLLTHYLYKYHPPRWEVITPRVAFNRQGEREYLEQSQGWSRAEAFRRVCRALREQFPEHPAPFLLHVYLKQGAELLGPPALEPGSGKFCLPLFIAHQVFENSAERVRD